VSGKIRFETADVEFLISTKSDNTGERSITIDDQIFEIGNEPGLHVKCYEEILKGNGLRISDIERMTLFMSEF